MTSTTNHLAVVARTAAWIALTHAPAIALLLFWHVFARLRAQIDQLQPPHNRFSRHLPTAVVCAWLVHVGLCYAVHHEYRAEQRTVGGVGASGGWQRTRLAVKWLVPCAVLVPQQAVLVLVPWVAAWAQPALLLLMSIVGLNVCALQAWLMYNRHLACVALTYGQVVFHFYAALVALTWLQEAPCCPL